jgi:hypothetical protein
MRGWNAVAGLRARNGRGPPCRISPDPRMTKALLSLARLRLLLQGALLVTQLLTATIWS